MFISKPTEIQAQVKERTKDDLVLNSWDYAPEAIEYVHEKTQLNKGMILADINSGIGKLTKHFLKLANTVYCIEKNKQFRQIAAEKFWKNRNFIEMDGTADSTHIGSQTIDVITCGNGMMDCDAHGAIREFKRILKSDGWLVLIENIPFINGQRVFPSRPSDGMDDAYSKELMKFYYPHGPWERKEFHFSVHISKEEIPNLLRSFSNEEPTAEMIEIFERSSREEAVDISGTTILHIGQPRF